MPEMTMESERRCAIKAALELQRRSAFVAARCSLCGSARIAMSDGTKGACSFVCCADPLHDVDNGG